MVKSLVNSIELILNIKNSGKILYHNLFIYLIEYCLIILYVTIEIIFIRTLIMKFLMVKVSI